MDCVPWPGYAPIRPWGLAGLGDTCCEDMLRAGLPGPLANPFPGGPAGLALPPSLILASSSSMNRIFA